MTIREILEKLHCKAYEGSNNEEDIARAEQAIKKAVIEELPLEKQGIKFHSGRQNSEMSAYSPTDNQKIGWNDCLKEIKERLNGK